MTGPRNRIIIAMLAITTAAACSSMNRTYMSGGDVDLSVATPAKLEPGEVTVLRQMSDANILGHLMTLDSLEVTLADTALYHVKTDDVGAYAKMMHLAHEDDWKALKDIASSTGLVPTLDVEKLRTKPVAAGLDSVRKTSDVTKDQLFMRTQIEMHREALAELQVLDGVARNRMLREHISSMIPVVRDHLARAMAIAKPLGVR